MHEVAVLTIWFSLNIGAMIVTMFLPHIFPDAPARNARQEQLGPVPSEEGVRPRRTSEVQIDKAA